MALKQVTLTSGTSWTVPAGCYIFDVFMVGGGGGGGSGSTGGAGGGGGGGSIRRDYKIFAEPGDVITYSIGAGGSPGNAGGNTTFGGRTAIGGSSGTTATGVTGGTGGGTRLTDDGVITLFSGSVNSGGASPANNALTRDGSAGYSYLGAFYSGGGGAGIPAFTENTPRPIPAGIGGSGGGGNGAGENTVAIGGQENPATVGAANTGGGGGGGGAEGNTVERNPIPNNSSAAATYKVSPGSSGAAGGSGIIIITYDEAEFNLSLSQNGVAEGGSISVRLETRNVWNGANFPFTLSGTNILDDDFVPAGLTGTFTIATPDQGKSGSSTVVLTTTADVLKETDIETVTLSLSNGAGAISFDIGDLSQSALENVESKKIAVADFNNIQSKVAKVLGPATTVDPGFGWGQNVRSSQVTVSNKVSATNWANLRADIINGWIHLYNTTPPLVSATANSVVRANISDAPYGQYDTYANVLTANRFSTNVNQALTQTKYVTDTAWPGVYGATWNTRIFCLVSVAWTNARQAREFFNSGGEIRFAMGQTGGAVTAQNDSWNKLLTSIGTRAFGGNKPGQGLNPNDGTNYYRLRSSFDVWYSASSSNPYSANTIQISARSVGVTDNSAGTASTLEFLIEWLDNHPSLGGSSDAVDGTFNLGITTLEPSGTGAGAFVVSSPTVTSTTGIRT
jgi:hypothetical protein